MNDFDVILLWILVVLAFLAAVMRILLAKKQGQKLSWVWRIQEFIFPVLLLVGLVLYQSGTKDVVFQLVMLGLAEEIVCIFLRRRSRKQTASDGSDT